MSRLPCIKFALASCAFALAALASASAAPALSRPPEVPGDWLQYLHSKLPVPSPVVVFIYTSSKNLVGVVEIPATGNNEIIHETADAISAEDFSHFEPKISSTDTSLKNYLGDMGYSMSTVVSAETKYTLLLAALDLKGEACATSLKLRNQIEQAVRDATEQPSAKGAYTVRSLGLEPSATFKIECRDSI